MPTSLPPSRCRAGAQQAGRVLPAMLLGLVVGAGFFWLGRESRPPLAAIEPRPVTARADLGEGERSNIEVFRTVSPSVVHITTVAHAQSFFSPRVTEVPRGTGTGFIWDTEGHVVTNFHVIQGSDGARVTLADQSSYEAELVGAFADRDLAVLRIAAPRERLPPILIGKSADLEVGQIVYAIGNPFGLDQTLTTGIVSALDREIESMTRRTIRGAIQTDAAINPGNSGGPLLDSAGRLIGVNTSIFSPSGASAGIGFAIPVDEVNRVVPRLIRDGRVVRPTLGISAAPADLNAALQLGKGIAILGVEPGGPADEAGLRPFLRDPAGGIVMGDLIISVEGEKVDSFDAMLEQLERHQPGARVKLTVMRADEEREVEVVLGTPE
ncbi:MAG: S1C family serine protease [Panacagrimonas sp.]